MALDVTIDPATACSRARPRSCDLDAHAELQQGERERGETLPRTTIQKKNPPPDHQLKCNTNECTYWRAWPMPKMLPTASPIVAPATPPATTWSLHEAMAISFLGLSKGCLVF
jgi:hypothetical protein